MKLKGKDVGEYDDIKDLAEAVEGDLDEFVVGLQKSVLRQGGRFPNYRLMGMYLGIITRINQQHGTDYAARFDKIKAHFESPARG